MSSSSGFFVISPGEKNKTCILNLSYYIAKRYLFSKKSVNAINFISGISMLGVFVGSAALVIILSVFNGFESIVLSMYNTFSPEIRIEPAKGKLFDPATAYFTALKKDIRVLNYTEVLQEKALIHYKNTQYIALVKGVSAGFLKVKQLDSAIIEGSFTLNKNNEDFAVIGSGVRNYLSVNIQDEFSPLEIYSPKKGVQNSVNPADEFVVRSIYPAGVFEVQQEFDNMVLVPLGFARQLLLEERNISFIELNLKENVSVPDFQDELKKGLGKSFIIKNRSQQNELLYKILNSEKWAIFLILTFVLVIAICNIIGSLTMLVIDKRQDIAVLSSLGATRLLIRKIFFTEGMMISMLGCVLGMAAGFVFCLLQQHYGFIKMNSVNLITESYPVTIKWADFTLVFLTVFIISLLASGISSQLSIARSGNIRDDL
ncbi:MAG: FtsX-like permease family protein [Daejeonella sp.]